MARSRHAPQRRGALSWPWLSHQQLGRERLPSADQWWDDSIVRIPWLCPEPVEALAEVPDETMGLTESLCSPGGLALVGSRTGAMAP